ncbi:MAG: flavodoxin-dependent (E)-4-hydroxy-3-methylbut-2-enyl-diphosphate synthase [Firmicutes bacterium]|nr:flavodoxin-dependent (E)-4-hydroxy-3-methylbut-2-enyl-diphosphate synthase [Bacillota bacterium]
MKERKQTRQIRIGDIAIGGGAPIVIQSMNNTKTADVESTLSQLNALKANGCQIGRLAVPDTEAAEALKEIVSRSPMPLVADIHFDHRLALKAVESGIDALRINPGNIGSEEKVKAVIDAAKDKNIPIRIGINGGSLEKDLLAKYGCTAEAIVESALREVAIFEKYGFDQVKISVKSSSVEKTVEAYKLLSSKVDYPLHVGVTEAGTLLKGSVKSAIGIGLILSEGIGDTIRVSLTGDPVNEVIVAKEILKNLGLREEGIEIISCPTCGRTKVDLESMVNAVERELQGFVPKRPLTVAVMGCEVNGPGEAKEADYGIANGKGQGLLFKEGTVIGKYKEEEIVAVLVDEIRRNEQ